MVEDIRDPAASSAFCCGSARKLPGGNWVMSWGLQPFITELTPSGRRVFRLVFPQDLFTYRANPLPFGRLDRTAVRRGMDVRYPRIRRVASPGGNAP